MVQAARRAEATAEPAAQAPTLRHGQWVQFPSDAPEHEGAHRSPEGNVVGIYQAGFWSVPPVVTRSGEDPPADPPAPEWVPPHVTVVAPDGHDHVILVDRKAVSVQVDPAKLRGLAPVLDLAHLPASRRAGLPDDFRLRP